MDTPVLSSTFLLTLLLLVGLFFFIRASVKDRTQVVKFVSDLTTESLAEQLQLYFVNRAYQVIEVNTRGQAIAFEGIVRPSVFLAVFVTFIAGIGLSCLSLVLSTLYSGLPGAIYYLMLFFAPLAGVFYWRRAERPEKVVLKYEFAPDAADHPSEQSIFTIQAHRDELLELQRTLLVKQFGSS
jgi:hypothetical protein